VKASSQGVLMMYIILRMAETLDNAFANLVENLGGRLGSDFPILLGAPS
jgi:hypothetical protein